MATRLKTVKFGVPTYVTLIPDATTQALAQINLYIPESTVTFKSVTVEIGFADVITATGGTITEHRVGLQLGSAGFNTFTETDDITNSGENIAGVIGPIDFTSYFNTNWSGTSMTCDIQVYFDQSSGTTLGMINVNALITVTYEYDDNPSTNATQIKTVFIPLESLVGALTTTANSNIGSNQIPILTSGGLLPEDGITIRDYFFLIEGNQSNNNTTTDFAISVNIDSGTPLVFGTNEAALASDCFQRFIYKPSSVPDTTSTHNFQMWSSVANKFAHVTITLIITYEFTPASSTALLNSIIIPIEIASPLGISTSANASRFTRDFYISDPDTITLKQSSFRINFNTTATIAGLAFKAGGQSYRGYTHLGNTICGMYSLQQRIDSNGAQGAGITLSRGKNTLIIDGYATDTADQATNINGCLILNYESGKPSSGLVGENNHTVEVLLSAWNALLADRVRVDNYSFSIPETNYWIVSAGFLYTMWTSIAANAISFDVQALAGEGKGAGYYDIYTDAIQTDTERACSMIYMRGRDIFKRYPTDPDTERLDLEIARSYRLYNAATAGTGMMMLVTYHSHTYTISGTISGYSGDGSGIEVYIFRESNDEKVGVVTTTTGGSFTFTWYNDFELLYAVAYEDSTHMGRSANDYAV